MTTEHQPGSPGAVPPVTALELEICEAHVRAESGSVFASVLSRVVSELRTLRARVAELETWNANQAGQVEALERIAEREEGRAIDAAERAESAEARVKELEAELSACDVSEDELAAARDITRDYDEVRYRLVHLAGREEPGGDPIREFVTEIESRGELIESQLAAAREAARFFESHMGEWCDECPGNWATDGHVEGCGTGQAYERHRAILECEKGGGG